MANEPPKLTIRVGQDVFDDVEDFLVVVRTKGNAILSRTTSYCWAHGAMEKLITQIQQNNIEEAGGDGGAG